MTEAILMGRRQRLGAVCIAHFAALGVFAVGIGLADSVKHGWDDGLAGFLANAGIVVIFTAGFSLFVGLGLAVATVPIGLWIGAKMTWPRWALTAMGAFVAPLVALAVFPRLAQDPQALAISSAFAAGGAVLMHTIWARCVQRRWLAARGDLAAPATGRLEAALLAGFGMMLPPLLAAGVGILRQ